MPVLRAITERGETYDDPSEDLLFILLGEVDQGESEFLIVERTADANEQTYIQTVRNADGSYTVERREGDASRHFQTIAPDRRAAHRLFTGWSFDLPAWDAGRSWSKVELHG